MQDVVFDRPYQFVSPWRTRFWPNVMRPLVPWYLNRKFGVTEVRFTGDDLLAESISRGDAILLAANHCRPCDPIVIGKLYGAIPDPFYFVAAWHVFLNHRIDAWIARRLGAYSLYREGPDRQSLALSIEILENAERPLVVFPEGGITRTSDVVRPLMDGTAWLARQSARRRAAADPPKRVVIHPVAIRYVFCGEPETAFAPMLADAERRIGIGPDISLPWKRRVEQLREALVARTEIRVLGSIQPGDCDQRNARLIEHLLVPLEDRWLAGRQEPHCFARTKALRTAIVTAMLRTEPTGEERERYWRQLADIYEAQLLCCYPPGYLAAGAPKERWIETLERIEEHLTDDSRVVRPWKAVMRVGEAMVVPAVRNPSGQPDPINAEVRDRLQTMVDALAGTRPETPAER